MLGVMSMLNLSNLEKNKTAIIKKISTSAGEERLLEMGFIEDSIVKVMYLGVGGNPIAVRINNNNMLVSLRKQDAIAILVEPTHA